MALDIIVTANLILQKKSTNSLKTMIRTLVFLLISSSIYSQSFNGTSGLIHIPSARIIEDGKLVIGAAYIPKPYFIGTGGTNRLRNLKIKNS